MENHPIHKFPIELVLYDPSWPLMFKEEAQRLTPIFGENLVTIHHIGSTSIPNLTAKPLIDMMPVVYDLTEVDSIYPQIEELGYICMGEFGIPGRRFFCKSIYKRTHNVHVFQQGNPNIDHHLKFRDTLRQQPDLAEQYTLLKLKLAREYKHDRKAYTDGKSEFIRKIETLT